jgi:hypothetical protein
MNLLTSNVVRAEGAERPDFPEILTDTATRPGPALGWSPAG